MNRTPAADSPRSHPSLRPLAFTVLLLAALLVTGCVTEGGQLATQSAPDLAEAARLNTQLGIDYMRKGQVELAKEKLERAIEQDEEFAPAHASLAVVYAQLGRAKDAKRHYREALSLDSRDPSVKNNFGIFLCSQGEVEDAVEYFLEAARDRAYATPEAAWTNAGVCARRLPDLEKAERYFREALRINPAFPDALAQMALLSFENKDYLRARAFVQRYELVGPPNPDMLWIGSQIEQELGNPVTAARYESRLRKEFPESDSAYKLRKTKGMP